MELRKRNRMQVVQQAVTRAIEPMKRFDVYPKLKEDHKKTEKTALGAAVTIASIVVIFVLFCSEMSTYLTVDTEEEMMVDPTLGQRLDINLDITFHALHCGEVNLDAMDVAGEQQNGVAQDIVKTRLTAQGQPIGTGVRVQAELADTAGDRCGNCYGAESDDFKCCNTCEELIKAYEHKGWNTLGLGSTEQCKDSNIGQPGEGCHLKGHLDVNKVAGNFHFAMGVTHTRDNRHIHQFNPSQIPNFNVSHTIHSLRFGDVVADTANPLDDHVAVNHDGTGVYQYYLKLVPLRRRVSAWGLFKKWAQSCLFSATTSFRPAVVDGRRQNVLPGVFFVYDFSPFMVTRNARSMPFFEFLTGLFAILGGVITVAGMIHSVSYHAARVLAGKNGLLSPKSAASGGPPANKLGTD